MLTKKKYIPQERLSSAIEQRAESTLGECELTGCFKHVVGVCDDGAEAGQAAENHRKLQTRYRCM
jgi:hypothetical protein